MEKVSYKLKKLEGLNSKFLSRDKLNLCFRGFYNVKDKYTLHEILCKNKCLQKADLNIVHFHNGTGGGVLTVIKNLLKFSTASNVRNHVIHAVNPAVVPAYKIEPMEGAVSQQLFYYNAQNNFYHTCRQLAKLLPDKNAIIVAHNWAELGMVSNLGLQNKVVQVLHGNYDYYYELAIKNNKAIDAFVCIAKSIQQKLTNLLPQRKDDIDYLRFPVADSKCGTKMHNSFNVVFIGRCTEEKGYHLLPSIAASLAGKGIQANWHIAGELGEAENKLYKWDDEITVNFYGNIANEKVMTLLCEMDVLVLPSIAEGMPVNIIEAMKAGVVPVVNDLPGGIQELVLQNETGITITGNQAEGFADAIMKIAVNNNDRQYMAANARKLANEMFDPISNTVAIENLYAALHDRLPKKKQAVKVYGSRLDYPWIGNCITKSIRRRF